MSADYTSERIQHLGMIQGVVTRMAAASTSMKNLCLILVAAALAFVATTKNPTIPLYIILLVVVFWVLDANYLKQEKWFRDIYDRERIKPQSERPDFIITRTLGLGVVQAYSTVSPVGQPGLFTCS